MSLQRTLSPRTLRSLCTPAYIYFVVSMMAIIAIAVQNRNNRRSYSLGNMHWTVPHTAVVFAIKIGYVFFWSWVLNLMCNAGYPSIAWVLVISPIVVGAMIVMKCCTYTPPPSKDPFKTAQHRR